MARPPLYDDALRARLLVETATLIDRHGADGTSLRTIARAADTSTSAVYTLFGSREDLFVAVIDDAFSSFLAAQQAAEPAGLRALGYAYRIWALAHPPLYRLMFTTTLASIVTPTPTPEHSTLNPLQHLVEKHLPDASAQHRAIAALAIWAQVHGAVALQLTDMHVPPEGWDAVYEVILDQIEAAYPAPAG